MTTPLLSETASPQETNLVSVKEAREVLGNKAKSMTDSQIKELLAKYQELAKWWLDEFEIKKFGRPILQFIR